MHDSRLIANKFLQLARQAGTALTPMQLLKLVYIAHGWMLALHNSPLTRDRIEAWKYGPVIPNLYHSVKQWGSLPVGNDLPTMPGDQLLPVEEDLITQVYNLYGKYSGMTLSNITHEALTPWARTYVPDVGSLPISDDIIREHYQHLAATRQGAQ